jgi:AraC-like DNA-binding protein
MYKPIQYIDQTRLHPGICYREYSPSPALSEYVACYWTLYTNGKINNEPHRILPDGCIDIIFDLNSHVSFISGVASETSHLLLSGTIDMMGVRFLPKAIPFILKSNASEFLNNGFETGFVVKSLCQMIENVLCAADRFQKLRIIDDELKIFFKDFSINGRFSGILEQALDGRGCLTVSELAAYHEISEKQLGRYFKEYVGLPTKTFLNIVRFQNMLTAMKNKNNNILNQSLDLGYYDQSHFIKDINKYYGNIKNIY